MDFRHVKGCEYDDEDRIDKEEKIKTVREKLLLERKKNFHEHDNYCYNPSIQICPNVYCNIFSDLSNWFGFKNCMSIDVENLNTCFTDITNGGVGYYEKLIVLGGKILELFSELHFYNKYASEKNEEIVTDLKNLKDIKEVVYHYLYVQKRKNRVVFKNSLYLFGYSYLYTPLFFNNKNSIIKYVKACIAYAVKFNKSNLYSWMPSLIDHIYHSQKLKVSEIESENALIQDLQEYFGYPFDYILPRIAECFSSNNLYISNSNITGLQIIRIFGNEYFSHLADDVGVYGKEKAIWVKEETEAFLNSRCIEIFSGTMVSINKFLNENNTKISKIRNIFEMLVSSCWILVDEKKSKIWVSALIQRLRQIQLLTQITTIEKWAFSIQRYNDINLNNFVNDIYNFNNINGSILSPFQLQNVNPLVPSKETRVTGIPYYTTLADKYKERFGDGTRGKEKENEELVVENGKKEVNFSNVIHTISNSLAKHFSSRKPSMRTSLQVQSTPQTKLHLIPPGQYESLRPSISEKQRRHSKKKSEEMFRIEKKLGFDRDSYEHDSKYYVEYTDAEEETNEYESSNCESFDNTKNYESYESNRNRNRSSNLKGINRRMKEEEIQYQRKQRSCSEPQKERRTRSSSNSNTKKQSGIPVKIKYVKDSKNDENSKYIIEIPKKQLKGRMSKDHLKAVLWGGNGKKGLEINIPTMKSRS